MAGVQQTTSTFVKPFVASATAFTRAAVSEGLMFIFQLPAMIFLRIFEFFLFCCFVKKAYFFMTADGLYFRCLTPAALNIFLTVSRKA